MSYINREEAIRLIMEYQGGAMDKPTARKVLEGMDGIEICKDTISRQAAIDAFEKELSAKYNRLELAIGFVGVKSILDNLPSAQPEIIRCKDCKFWTHVKRTNRYWCKTDDGLYDLNPSPDDFCSRAERRTDEIN